MLSFVQTILLPNILVIMVKLFSVTSYAHRVMPNSPQRSSPADNLHGLDLSEIKMLESYLLVFQVHMCSRSRPRMQMTQPMETALESFIAFCRDNLISLLIPRQVNVLLETALPPCLQTFKLALNLGMGSCLF